MNKHSTRDIASITSPPAGYTDLDWHPVSGPRTIENFSIQKDTLVSSQNENYVLVAMSSEHAKTIKVSMLDERERSKIIRNLNARIRGDIPETRVVSDQIIIWGKPR